MLGFGLIPERMWRPHPILLICVYAVGILIPLSICGVLRRGTDEDSSPPSMARYMMGVGTNTSGGYDGDFATWIQESFDSDFCQSVWKDTVYAILHGSYPEFHDSVTPFYNASWLMYMYRDHDKRFMPRGWHLFKQHYPMFEGKVGMHALAFQSDDEPYKIMISIRGTWDMDQTQRETQSDICADWYLMRFQPKPTYCDHFNVAQLNYFQQLKEFLIEVRASLPPTEKVCLSFTGHSLGALLSGLMSAAFQGKMPGITFSAPGIIWAANLLGVPLKDEYSENTINVYTEFDPVVKMPTFFTNQTNSSWGCEYDKPCIPKDCLKCYHLNNLDFTALDTPCGTCYEREHSDGDDLKSFVLRQQIKPNCTQFKDYRMGGYFQGHVKS